MWLSTSTYRNNSQSLVINTNIYDCIGSASRCDRRAATLEPSTMASRVAGMRLDCNGWTPRESGPLRAKYTHSSGLIWAI
jgi:hypothetical protein